jgi:hypothetical protein
MYTSSLGPEGIGQMDAVPDMFATGVHVDMCAEGALLVHEVGFDARVQVFNDFHQFGDGIGLDIYRCKVREKSLEIGSKSDLRHLEDALEYEEAMRLAQRKIVIFCTVATSGEFFGLRRRRIADELEDVESSFPNGLKPTVIGINNPGSIAATKGNS